MFKIYCIKVDDQIDKNTFNYLTQFVQPEKKGRILKQRVKQNADNMLIGEILAKAAIKKNFGIDIAKQNFTYTEYGKPYLLNYTDVHFNISHSGEYVACAVSNKPVGVDIQKIGEYNPGITERICNEIELEQIEKSSDKASEFTKLWTKKEAILKMYGTGIANGDIKNCLKDQEVQSQKMGDYWICYAN
jgi:4'-phosphopantetheinyl transferase